MLHAGQNRPSGTTIKQRNPSQEALTAMSASCPSAPTSKVWRDHFGIKVVDDDVLDLADDVTNDSRVVGNVQQDRAQPVHISYYLTATTASRYKSKANYHL